MFKHQLGSRQYSSSELLCKLRIIIHPFKYSKYMNINFNAPYSPSGQNNFTLLNQSKKQLGIQYLSSCANRYNWLIADIYLTHDDSESLLGYSLITVGIERVRTCVLGVFQEIPWSGSPRNEVQSGSACPRLWELPGTSITASLSVETQSIQVTAPFAKA